MSAWPESRCVLDEAGDDHAVRPADRVFSQLRVMLCASVCATAGRSQLSAAMRR